MAPYFVYIIRYIDDASGNVCYYTGQTNNPERRKSEHAQRGFIAKHARCDVRGTTRFITWRMKCISTHSTRAGAMLEERRVKRLSHDRKEQLFQGVV